MSRAAGRGGSSGPPHEATSTDDVTATGDVARPTARLGRPAAAVREGGGPFRSALLVAALLVAIGVFLTLGGVDALVGHGAVGPGVHPSLPSSPAPTSVRPTGLL